MSIRRYFDLVGQRFERLTVVALARITEPYRVYWRCVCACGREHVVRSDSLQRGLVRSCGCLHRETAQRLRFKHGGSTAADGSGLYNTWRGIIKRCTNPAHRSYRHYGARGITVHADWLQSYVCFREWVLAHLGPRPDGQTLDRIDNSGPYAPGNVRWATWDQQAHSRRPMSRSRTGRLLQANG